MQQPQGPIHGQDDWARQALEKLASNALDEQKRSRRWGIFFKTLTFAYLFIILGFMVSASPGSEDRPVTRPHTALVELQGAIMPDGPVTADDLSSSLRKAFANPNSKAVILRVNSPGGSPVQAGRISDEIKRLKAEYPDKKLYVVADETMASAAYYVAAGADEIYADKASLVGSIGVLMDTFGFVDTMKLLGVERRLITAGENKGFLDPFSPLSSKQKAFAEKMVATIHQQFISVVREGRGDRLKESPEIFSGLVWSGEDALALGLIDGLKSTGQVARDVVGEERIVNYTQQEDVFERFAKKVGLGVAQAMATGLAQFSANSETRIR
ncbi:S49 family peptidase [Pelagibaculum spongiae]|uniref:S49 family peptidase n=1 Tax=Pelagibaculum spongiae TaxID=2080658 RepID=A0A2V1H172_9GAMM|nr:S49 family peptidase [Pelagibaculum spongiae]PVZ69049.1 S49 family peptidase [Pelagibaculum spongiae]